MGLLTVAHWLAACEGASNLESPNSYKLFFLALGISCDWILEVCHYSQFEGLEVRPGVPGRLPKCAKLICKLFSTGLSPHESISEKFWISFSDLEKLWCLWTFWQKSHYFEDFWVKLDEDWGQRVQDGELWVYKGSGQRMENWEFKIEGEGCGLRIGNHDLRIYHATPTINTHISGQPLLQILLFWGHCKVLNLPLEGNLQLFPGLQFFMINKLNLKQLCEQTINISTRNFVCVVEYIFQRSKFWLFFFINMYMKWHLCWVFLVV